MKHAQWVGKLVSNKVEQLEFLITLITYSTVNFVASTVPLILPAVILLYFSFSSLITANYSPSSCAFVAYLLTWWASLYWGTEPSWWLDCLGPGSFIILFWQGSPKLLVLELPFIKYSSLTFGFKVEGFLNWYIIQMHELIISQQIF